ncbi:FAD:protein FMN transferase [Allorhodopirellula heiligendammensis]|nr:FAD:protein FMN transferase [Allorhodopirellula heiligendammensis]
MIQSDRMTRRGFRPVAFFNVTLTLVLTSLFAAVAPGLAMAQAPPGSLLYFGGETMGTTYSVKVSRPPDDVDWKSKASLAVDEELRRVNDQMSTYLKSSELTRFNDSASTDWFEVSRETAEVVQFALHVGKKSEGAFDVTVGPLVDRWSFGPGKRNQDVPSDEELDSIAKRIGQAHLSARLDPPALRKDIPNLRVDLSAIAKGHGVDRVVDVLNRLGAENVFVEIGGEVRVTGDKLTSDGSQSWRVGIQKPDAMNNEIVVAYAMDDVAMATSGDYRNYFEVDGTRFSHTIDPVTHRPVRHNMASVTVIAPTCMAADAWATALDVVGPERAVALADENDLDTLLITRGGDPAEADAGTNEAEEDHMNFIGTGSLATIADQMQRGSVLGQAKAEEGAGFLDQMGPVLLLTAIGFAAVLVAMAIGVMFGRQSISGSCGGLNARTDEDGVSRCSLCSSPSEGCEKLREKIENS